MPLASGITNLLFTELTDCDHTGGPLEVNADPKEAIYSGQNNPEGCLQPEGLGTELALLRRRTNVRTTVEDGWALTPIPPAGPIAWGTHTATVMPGNSPTG